MLLSEQDIKEAQKKSLEIMLVFQKFCEEHGLLYYFCGGCCIGTIRHKGFVPWDDDLDLFMPRDDYEKLQQLWEREGDKENYSLIRSDEKHNYHTRIMQFCDNNTTYVLEKRKNEDMCHGFFIEIIPLDGCPESRWKRKKQIGWALIHQIFCLEDPLKSRGPFIEGMCRVLLGMFPGWKRKAKVWKYAEKKITQYPIQNQKKITEMFVRYQYMKNEYPKEWFASAVYKEFAGHSLPIPVGYDPYLRKVFGDYMQMPPEDKRVPYHEVEYFDLHHSYREYKGIHYCVKEDK